MPGVERGPVPVSDSKTETDRSSEPLQARWRKVGAVVALAAAGAGLNGCAHELDSGREAQSEKVQSAVDAMNRLEIRDMWDVSLMGVKAGVDEVGTDGRQTPTLDVTVALMPKPEYGKLIVGDNVDSVPEHMLHYVRSDDNKISEAAKQRMKSEKLVEVFFDQGLVIHTEKNGKDIDGSFYTYATYETTPKAPTGVQELVYKIPIEQSDGVVTLSGDYRIYKPFVMSENGEAISAEDLDDSKTNSQLKDQLGRYQFTVEGGVISNIRKLPGAE